MLKIKLPLVSLALMSASPGLFAEELVVNGFMSVGAGVLSNSEVSVKGYDDDISFSADTVVGVQLSKQVNDFFYLITGRLIYPCLLFIDRFT